MALARDIGWIAGIIEGEGYIRIDRRGTYPKVSVIVGMADGDIVERLEYITRMGIVSEPKDKGPNRDPMFFWSVHEQKDVAALLMTIYTIMGEKRKGEIREALSAWRSFPYRHMRPCIKGHPRTKETYYIDSRGRGSCKICRAEASRRLYNRRALGY